MAPDGGDNTRHKEIIGRTVNGIPVPGAVGLHRCFQDIIERLGLAFLLLQLALLVDAGQCLILPVNISTQMITISFCDRFIRKRFDSLLATLLIFRAIVVPHVQVFSDKTFSGPSYLVIHKVVI